MQGHQYVRYGRRCDRELIQIETVYHYSQKGAREERVVMGSPRDCMTLSNDSFVRGQNALFDDIEEWLL